MVYYNISDNCSHVVYYIQLVSYNIFRLILTHMMDYVQF
jgi:hypothetical protein